MMTVFPEYNGNPLFATVQVGIGRMRFSLDDDGIVVTTAENVDDEFLRVLELRLGLRADQVRAAIEHNQKFEAALAGC